MSNKFVSTHFVWKNYDTHTSSSLLSGDASAYLRVRGRLLNSFTSLLHWSSWWCLSLFYIHIYISSVCVCTRRRPWDEKKKNNKLSSQHRQPFQWIPKWQLSSCSLFLIDFFFLSLSFFPTLFYLNFSHFLFHPASADGKQLVCAKNPSMRWCYIWLKIKNKLELRWCLKEVGRKQSITTRRRRL